MTEMIY